MLLQVELNEIGEPVNSLFQSTQISPTGSRAFRQTARPLRERTKS